MNNETKLNILTSFVEHRLYLMNTPNLGEKLDSKFSPKKPDNSFKYVNDLMEQPISKSSKFSDSIWDFNADYPHAARNVQGAKLCIDYTKYESIPKFILIEIKVIFELALLNNLIFRPKNSSRKGSKKGMLKANTLIPIFKSGLEFINEIFKILNEEFGHEFIQYKFQSLSDIDSTHYNKAAKTFDQLLTTKLYGFFEYMRSPSSTKYVFDKSIIYVDLESLDWKKKPNKNKQEKDKILPDKIFEHLSKMTSFIVVDFLSNIGEKSKISDIHTLERFSASKYSSWANKEKINLKMFNYYIALRLRAKGYSPSSVFEKIELDKRMNNKVLLMGDRTIRKSLKNAGFNINNLREYFNLVAYSCLYLVGQYTGMRPSELAEIKVENCSCLVEENGIWLIKSSLKKHQQEINTGLFDDKWVAIPIIRDAILAASHISKIKSSPYLVSNVDTVKPNSNAVAMKSSGLSYQINNLITQLLGHQVADQIKFNPYMLRHTLTYQLFRAEVGLPLISFQLKHFVDNVNKFTSMGATSNVTLGYGEIGELLSKGGSRKTSRSLRHSAELEVVKAVNNPNAAYYGSKAAEHKQNLIKIFQGYMAAGYTEEEIYEAMTDQGMAVVYVGQGICYGNRTEEFDSSLPCIGSLRCNPARCSQAIVTSTHAPKWREVYILNKANLNKPEYAYNRDQIKAAMDEAVMVLESLGEEVEL